MAKPPRQKPGKSKQDYQTPVELLRAVKTRLRIDRFDYDLAASPENAVCRQYYTEKDNALIQPWGLGEGWDWCNPPFAKLAPWVMKAYETGSKICMLVPASVGSNWWDKWVHNKAYVLFLNPRLTFVGCNSPYPKDCAILLYGLGKVGYDVWKWSI